MFLLPYYTLYLSSIPLFLSLPTIMHPELSPVRHDDDGMRCERHCETVGGSAPGGQISGGRVFRPRRSGEATAQSATRGDDGSVICLFHYTIALRLCFAFNFGEGLMLLLAVKSPTATFARSRQKRI